MALLVPRIPQDGQGMTRRMPYGLGRVIGIVCFLAVVIAISYN